MRVVCMTCMGAGASRELRGTISGHTATVHENCRTCGGSGWYDATTGPGVHPHKRHGTGAERPDTD